MDTRIPVICDRCRDEGTAGDDPFAQIRDLLEFEPVPRRAHVNGWTPELQRAFIAALALTGSPNQAARTLGRWASGAEQLRKGKGGRSFADAWQSALELHREREFFRIKDSLAALAEQQAERDEIPLAATHLKALPPPSRIEPPDLWPEDYEPPVAKELTDALFAKFILKLRSERKARLAGRIAEADFYLRQISFFEVALELVNEDTFIAFQDLRRGDFHLVDIAETDGTRCLDRLRRRTWLELELERLPDSDDEPGEGPHDPLALDLFPSHTLKNHGGFSTQPSWNHGPYAHPAEGHDAASWAGLDQHERRDAYEAQHARAAAEEQVKWEAEMLHWAERAAADKLGPEDD